MSAREFQSSFVRRFDRIWAQARQVQLSQAICWAVLTVFSGVALLAAADYYLELSLDVRKVAILFLGFGAVAVAIALVMQSLRRWRKQATAATIEHVFPQLGQRIRTTIQCAALNDSQLQQAGMTPSLVVALDKDTVRVAQPLPLDAIVPWKSLALASLLTATTAFVLAAACAMSWQWRAAVARALLGQQPYTRIFVEPRDVTVQEGESLMVQIKVSGRTGSQIMFQSRRLDEADTPWHDENLVIDQEAAATDHVASLDMPLRNIRHPIEYRVTAGSAQSDIYRIAVLYPLKIVHQEATVQPPAYTRLPSTTTETADVTALVGSDVTLQILLDREPVSAYMETQSLAPQLPGVIPPTARQQLTIDGAKLTINFELSSDQTYSIVAKAADGMELPPNKFRLRARPDEPPQVWFDSPSDTIEVHTLAEVLMRIRTSDDFGLARVGIMFEVNNEEEYPLLSQDFEEAAEELRRDGELSAQTRATLEKVLPLEHFQLSQKDSVMYYAFAEDTRPGQAQRTETDLKFIDIRPFRRNYRSPDQRNGMGQGPRFRSLEEIITRQRYALTRTIQLERNLKQTGRPDLPATDALIKHEGELAQATRDFAEGLLERGVDETELMSQAETEMLAAADSLSAGNYATATLQMREALKYLIEGRNRLNILLQNNSLRNFDRLQLQKLRRPKSDEQEGREIAQRLDELAQAEEAVMAGLAPLVASSPPPDASRTASEELEDHQLDIAAEARAIEKSLSKLEKATDLVKERMTGAANQAEEVSEAIGRAALADANNGAGLARDQFRELARQIKAIFAQEQANRIAAAQQMAADLARDQMQLGSLLGDMPISGIGGPPANSGNPAAAPGMAPGNQQPQTDEQMRGLGGLARDLAEKSKTLSDVLAGASKAETPADKKSAEAVARLSSALNVKGMQERLQQLPGQLERKQFAEARAALGDGTERMESAAQQLGRLHRSLVAPQVDSLAQLEQGILKLDKQLDQLDSDSRVTQWHMEADDLIDKLEEAGIDKELPTMLREEMRKAGWGGDEPVRRWNWGRTVGGTLASPARYRMLLARAAADLRSRMQEYLLGDTQATGDEPIPPQYQDLVDRYYRVLAAERKSQPHSPAIQSTDKP
jgi:hypothetical protein